jgi:prepilin signal peptidase PulO-like enzyme (type II secretory pathway)
MILLPILIFVLGLLIGSFLNVVILRLHTGRSAVSGRSACARCARTLEWYELIPLCSFLALRGKCRTCNTQISFQYPVVEVTTAVLFLLFYIKLPLAASFTYYSWISYIAALVVISLLMVIAVYDARHKIIPDEIVYPLMLTGLVAIIVKTAFFSAFDPVRAVIDGVLVALPFFVLWVASRGRAMGFGDVKLALGLGWILGLTKGFTMVILSFWIGAIAGLFLLGLSKKYSMKSQIPFGPFLIAAAFIVSFWGMTISSVVPIFH